MPQLSKGTQLADRYTLDRHLGGGGEAETWLAKDRLTGAAVALKIVRNDPGATERLREEWQTNIRLMHAHIARVFEFHGDADHAFYSQQYIDGPDLGALAGKPLQQVLAPVGLIAEALRYAHGKGVVHRDIKASNILLDRNGAPYLSDFGVSSTVGSRKGGGSLIARSPQSLAGEAVQPADDIFALGGLIYELVSGRSPYSSSQTASDIQSHTPEPLRSADGVDIPPELQQLVAAMLDKDADKRPDAEHVVAQLRAAGFVPGPARIKIAARPTVADERVETVESVHPASLARTTAKPEVANVPKSGISIKTLGIALGALLLLLLGVVFLLPKTVSTDPLKAAARQAGQAATAEPAGGGDEEGVPGQGRASRDYVPESRGIGGEEILFNENEADYSGLDESGRARFNAEMILGELLSNFETLERRSVQRWAGAQFKRAQELYAAGDKAYLERDYRAAETSYLDAISVVEPLFEQIEPEFQKALTGAQNAFAAGDRTEALRLYELAVAITPNSPVALAGYERTRNLQSVLSLVDQGLSYEQELELEAAETSFRQAVEIDPLWEPAVDGLARVQRTRIEMEFDQRMSEGLGALATGDYLAARAAFRMAERLIPESPEPADGLLQVDQGLRLDNISVLEQEAHSLEQDEHWEAVATTYEEILKIDGNLSFAIDGLAHAREMSALHKKLDEYLSDPDKLSVPSVMQKATLLVVDITRMPEIGARLAAQRDELSRLLKRAVTPVPVALISDNLTNVSVYKVGNLGNFKSRELTLRPGTYVAVGIRPGFRDVRLEFRVAPEIEMQPVIVRCEEQI
ncbi:MAG: protein kinase [Gammaproteobacteria bacterium]|nr:protein kinase [Gammaproteobacteria bacterium]MBT8109719.1 protein kinase [Gammaproteobacteria bacterium]NND48283.1 protein kinase [Woeseiaceae bacterium]NNL44421.1 protein kinase [Woeseiaceae bacterium]